MRIKTNQWLKSDSGRAFLEQEGRVLSQFLRQVSGPNVLLVGQTIDRSLLDKLDFPLFVHAITADSSFAQGVRVNPAFLPFEDSAFASVILPHVIDSHPLAHQILRETHRVLRPDGVLMMTACNPFSLLALQNWRPWKKHDHATLYSFYRVKDWLRLLGFEILGSTMYQYAPLSQYRRLRNAFGFINAIGDRWLPMFGGSYLLVVKKRELGTRLVGRVSAKRNNKPKLVVSSARRHAKVGKLSDA